MAGPLNGVRVIELPAIGPVPFLGMLLADLGADVIRVDKLPDEPPDARPGAGSRTARAAAAARSRLDLRKPGGAEVVLRLAETCGRAGRGLPARVSPSVWASGRSRRTRAIRGWCTGG